MANGQWSMTFAQTTGIKNLYKYVKDTYETKADSLTKAFIESFMIKDKGIFNDRYKYYAFNAYWTQAHAIDVVIYNYQRHKGIDNQLANTYKAYMTRWYNNKANNYSGASTSDGSYRMFENPYTDDMCWITLTLFHMYEATGTTKYLTAAKNVFDNYIIQRANEDEETGGLWLPWNTDAGSGPNACTQSPATLIAAKLYQKYGTEKYLDYAKKLYAYTSKKIVKSDGRVEEPPLTYTQGTFGEACRILYHVTDESAAIKSKYKTLAYTYLNYAFTSGRCTNGQNILRDEGHNGHPHPLRRQLCARRGHARLQPRQPLQVHPEEHDNHVEQPRHLALPHCLLQLGLDEALHRCRFGCLDGSGLLRCLTNGELCPNVQSHHRPLRPRHTLH